MPDKRMFFIRNMESLKEEDSEYETEIFNVTSDSCIIGSFEYGPYSFKADDIEESKYTPITNLTLQVNNKILPETHPLLKPGWRENEKKGYYHGGGIPDEIVTLSSLFLRRRLISPYKRFSYGIKDHGAEIGLEGWIDEALIKGESNLCELNDWFEVIEGLNEDYHLKFMFAAKMYDQAIYRIEESPDMSYLNLVSAIEVFSQDFDINVTIEDIIENDKKFKRFLDSIEEKECRVKIEDEFLRKFKRDQNISKKFREFIKVYLPDNFFDNTIARRDMDLKTYAKEMEGQIHKVEIEDREIPNGAEKLKYDGFLKKIYNQRSETLHSGEAFQPHIYDLLRHSSQIEIPRYSRGYIADDRRWYMRDFIPYPHFFERLVNEVLKSFLKENSEN